MTEPKKEKWTSWLAVTTVIIAVCATLSTFKGGGYSTRSLLNQSKASDQWALYQSKSIKEYQYDLQKDQLQLQLNVLAEQKASAALQEEFENKAGEYEKNADRYEKEKKQIQSDAKAFESQRDECKKHSDAFGMAVIFLQVAILLSSIAALTKQRYVWILGLGVASVGLLYFVNGFWLFL